MGKEKKRQRFKIVNKDYAHGAVANISIVKRESDGKLLIWKQPISDGYWSHYFFQKEIKWSKLWRELGVSNIKVCWHPDGRSLLKTYVEGDTLEQILEKHQKFFSEPDSKPLKALRKFLELLIESKYYIGDLNSKNLVFDRKRWHIIDGGSASKRHTRFDTKQEYKRKFLEIWVDGNFPKDEIHSLESFIDSVKLSKHRK